MDHIEHGIYISDWEAAINEDLLKKNNIKAVICINTSLKDNRDFALYKKLNIKHFHILADDCISVDLKKWFKSTNKIIEYHVAKGMNILVHCRAGISRSVTVVMAYLIYLCHCRGNLRPNKLIIHNIYKYLRDRRKCALPNPAFYKQLMEYEKECFEAKGI